MNKNVTLERHDSSCLGVHSNTWIFRRDESGRSTLNTWIFRRDESGRSTLNTVIFRRDESRLYRKHTERE